MDENELTKLLKQIASTDKTPDYAYYSETGESENYLNADGIPPKTGCRWCTPREICNQYLKDIKSDMLDDALKRLMNEKGEREKPLYTSSD